MTTHTKTPLPWCIHRGKIASDPNPDHHSIGIRYVADMTHCDEAEANASMIVRAVNAHDRLVEALEALMAAAPAHRSGKRDGATMGRISIAMDKAEAALRAAKGEA